MAKKNRTSAEYQNAYLKVGAKLAANCTLSYLREECDEAIERSRSIDSASVIDEDAYKLEILQTLMAKLRSETEQLKSKISEKERREESLRWQKNKADFGIEFPIKNNSK